MKFSKIVASALAGAGFMGSVMAADAATVGGASLNISNGLLQSSAGFEDGEAGYFFNISGDFVAESLITDFAVVRDYDATVMVWDAAGVPVFNLILPLPAISINGVLAGFGGAGILDLLAPGLDASSGTLAIAGVDIDYSYSDLSITANAIAGAFTLALFIDEFFLADFDYFLGLGVSTPPASAEFSAEFAISTVPVPAALPLAFTGVALLGGLGFRRRRAAIRA